MGCPFGFGMNPGEDIHSLLQEEEDDARRDKGSPAKAKAKKGKFTAPPFDPDRFDYNKDPVSWFYQNQIKSEEDFQAKKAVLRDQARVRLEELFHKKGKHLVIDTDDDDFSIASSELSAWDSDVASISSLTSCAAEWVQEAKFGAPADTAMKYGLAAVLALAGHCLWRSIQAMTSASRYWGVISYGWVPAISAAVAGITLLAVAGLWGALGRRSRRNVMAFQMCLHVLVTCAVAVALLCWVAPSHLDSELKNSACHHVDARDSTSSRMCGFLPVIHETITLHMHQLLLGNAALGAGCLALVLLSSLVLYEICYVEKKAHKLKRRRRHRSHGIPWDKIKVENIGPISFCGGAPPAGVPEGATKAKSGGGKCPFAGMAGGPPAAAVEGDSKKTA